MPKNITYLRVSAPGQDLEKNKADVSNEKNLDEVEFVHEKVSSKVTSRNRKIDAILIDNMGRMASEMKFFLERNPIPEKFLKRGAPKI
ncbi:hypothetical protein [Dyadobacter frigoris]|uniref:Resolvase/invertase-type recombinase catalytic domain-containing protein n=1 Tax=Dyadobacter frigoris TaxID=2576211 RepID=A0A4U6CQ14_9BACT|nr:hypothetical protein [Dyadobacter frigoris]TKT85715.1 hypothetical protein FDK13_33310 [Dyadobacter frigoris]